MPGALSELCELRERGRRFAGGEVFVTATIPLNPRPAYFEDRP
jgi:hypothetical protein